MKVTVTQQHLAHGLSIVSRAVSPRSTLPVLSNVLLATDEGRLRLSATNLELGITCWIPAKIEEEGSITIPARTIVDLVGTFPPDNVVLALDERTQTLNLVCNASVHDIKGIDAQDFPPMPVYDPEEGVELNLADFKDMIQQVAFAASADEARPVLQGVKMEVIDNQITLAATDGFRISVRKENLSTPVPQEISIIIPARAMNELARIFSDVDKSVHMIVPPSRGQVIFHLKDAELVSQLIDGNFPDYRAIIPKSAKTKTIISTPAFLKACKQAEVIAREGNNVIRLDIMPAEEGPGKVEINAQTEETGKSDISVEANIEGSPLLIAFNVRFLREVLDVIHSPNVALETNANNSPGVIRPVGDEDFVHVIMPMHLG
ncbi:MAG TPA: DNA polymerase III subunit beta [Anaerolineaceae bacterium]|nr:DNA polymerase III subunit beta [Anaerolineaceae bacterium]HOV06025.1 DNA polymerase III subunit beta [Anaerolineaceae bacterium]